MSDRWDGVPVRPESSGWHWVEDASGLRPLLWRGDDWPETVDRREWQDGVVVCAPADLRGDRYFGPVAMPEAVADRFQVTQIAPPAPRGPGSWARRLGLS
ncbi:hypothetical protein ACLF3G_21910 [Falsiroseomonas sp. HC035]|uniref:hypothetical protein n=1 Tax=Falsiroseomonas sp. HC035 TaxID=3390999 RepID=UPI003D3153F8